MLTCKTREQKAKADAGLAGFVLRSGTCLNELDVTRVCTSDNTTWNPETDFITGLCTPRRQSIHACAPYDLPVLPRVHQTSISISRLHRRGGRAPGSPCREYGYLRRFEGRGRQAAAITIVHRLCRSCHRSLAGIVLRGGSEVISSGSACDTAHSRATLEGSLRVVRPDDAKSIQDTCRC